MIYDFCEIEYHLPDKGRGNFGLFEYTGFIYPKGHLFKAKAFSELNLYWNDRTNWLTLSGSLAFFFQGHNFKFDANALQKGFEFISGMVGCNIFNAHVTTFEAGELLATSHKPQAIFTTHTQIKGMKSKPYELGKWFEDRILRVKLYDAGKRMKKIIDKDIRNQLQADFGYQPDTNYIRVENHYKRPEIRFKQPVTLKDLVSDEFQNVVKNDIIQTYQSIMKTPTLILPEHLYKLSASDIYFIVAKELSMQCGVSMEEKIYSVLRSCNNMTKEDIKARKRKIKADFNRVTTNQCDYDLEESLRQKLYI